MSIEYQGGFKMLLFFFYLEIVKSISKRMIRMTNKYVIGIKMPLSTWNYKISRMNSIDIELYKLIW